MIKPYRILMNTVMIFVLFFVLFLFTAAQEDALPVIKISQTISGSAGTETVDYGLNVDTDQIVTIRVFSDNESATLVVRDVENNANVSFSLSIHFAGHRAYRYMLPASDTPYQVRVSPHNADYELRIDAGDTLYVESIPITVGDSVVGAGDPAGGTLAVYSLDLNVDQVMTFRIFSENTATGLFVRNANDNNVNLDLSATFADHIAYRYTLLADNAPYLIIVNPRVDYEIRVETGDTLLAGDGRSASVGDSMVITGDPEGRTLPFYILNLEDNQTITVRVGSDRTDIAAGLLDPHNARVSHADFATMGGYRNYVFNAVETGDYVLTIAGHVGEYAIEIEDGNTLYVVQYPLEEGAVATGSIDPDERQVTMYPLNMDVGAVVRVEVESIGRSVSFSVRDGNLRTAPFLSGTREQTDNAESIEYRLREPGPHALYLSGAGDYRVSVSVVSQSTLPQITDTLSIGSRVSGNLSLGVPVYYAIDVEPGEIISVYLEPAQSGLGSGAMAFSTSLSDNAGLRALSPIYDSSGEMAAFLGIPPSHYEAAYRLEGTPPFMLFLISNRYDLGYTLSIHQGDPDSVEALAERYTELNTSPDIVFSERPVEGILRIGDTVSGYVDSPRVFTAASEDAIIYEIDAEPGDMLTVTILHEDRTRLIGSVLYADWMSVDSQATFWGSDHFSNVYVLPEEKPYLLHIGGSGDFTVVLEQGDQVRDYREVLTIGKTIADQVAIGKQLVYILDVPPGIYTLELEGESRGVSNIIPRIYTLNAHGEGQNEEFTLWAGISEIRVLELKGEPPFEVYIESLGNQFESSFTLSLSQGDTLRQESGELNLNERVSQAVSGEGLEVFKYTLDAQPGQVVSIVLEHSAGGYFAPLSMPSLDLFPAEGPSDKQVGQNMYEATPGHRSTYFEVVSLGSHPPYEINVIANDDYTLTILDHDVSQVEVGSVNVGDIIHYCVDFGAIPERLRGLRPTLTLDAPEDQVVVIAIQYLDDTIRSWHGGSRLSVINASGFDIGIGDLFNRGDRLGGYGSGNFDTALSTSESRIGAFRVVTTGPGPYHIPFAQLTGECLKIGVFDANLFHGTAPASLPGLMESPPSQVISNLSHVNSTGLDRFRDITLESVESIEEDSTEPTTTMEITCTVSAVSNVNQRSQPSTSAAVAGTLQAGQSASVIGQVTDAAGFVWWQLGENVWVRSDVVTSGGDCGNVPISQP